MDKVVILYEKSISEKNHWFLMYKIHVKNWYSTFYKGQVNNDEVKNEYLSDQNMNSELNTVWLKIILMTACYHILIFTT